MKDCYLGVDIGSISTKGVIIDDRNIDNGDNISNIINTNDNYKVNKIFKYDDNIKEINEIYFGIFCF